MPAISGSADIFFARRSRTTGAVIGSPVWKRTSLRSVTVSCRPSSDSTSDSASLNTGRPSHAAATSGSELNTPARSTSGERPDFGRNVPIWTTSGSEDGTRRASPLQAAQAAAIAATITADARTRVADITPVAGHAPVEWRGRGCQCSSGGGYFFAASGGISTRYGHGSETLTLPLALLEHVDLHECVLWSEVVVGLLLRGLGRDFDQIRARIGNLDFAAGLLEHLNLHRVSPRDGMGDYRVGLSAGCRRRRRRARGGACLSCPVSSRSSWNPPEPFGDGLW